VAAVSEPGSEDFVPPAERIAVFDNDGTLWSEKPTYFQMLFILDRIRALAPEHPEWAHEQPFKAVLENDLAQLAAAGEHGLMQLAGATLSGMTTTEYEQIVTDWLAESRHPQTGRPFTEMVYQPMLELLDYLRAHGFRVYIVSGGGLAFMRPWTERVYGIPPENVIGSYLGSHYEVRDGAPTLVKDPELLHVNDKAGKPVGIERFIGRRPILAVGNSDGDYDMLEWTTRGAGRRLGVLLHHTDAEREWAYDRASSEGRLARGLDDAEQNGWVVIDMARDWKSVFPPLRP
jgi:phosphoserine phosphatase